MLLQRHYSRVCRKTHKTRAQYQRVFKTAQLYAVTNPEESAPKTFGQPSPPSLKTSNVIEFVTAQAINMSSAGVC
jgi:hypothetical protein